MLDALTANAVPAPAPAISPDRVPAALAVVDTSDTGADIVWSPIAGVTTYRVWRADAGGAFTAISDVAGPSFGDSSLKPNSSYRWRIAAVINGVEGPASSEIAASTLAAPAPCDTPGTCPLGR